MKILIAIEDKIFGEAIAQFVGKSNWLENSKLNLIHVTEPLHLDPLSGYSSEQLSALHDLRHREGKALLASIGTQLSTLLPS